MTPLEGWWDPGTCLFHVSFPTVHQEFKEHPFWLSTSSQHGSPRRNLSWYPSDFPLGSLQPVACCCSLRHQSTPAPSVLLLPAHGGREKCWLSPFPRGPLSRFQGLDLRSCTNICCVHKGVGRLWCLGWANSRRLGFLPWGEV